MSQRIWKFDVTKSGENYFTRILMPIGAEPISVKVQGTREILYAIIPNSDNDKSELRIIYRFKAGIEMPYQRLKYIDTTFISDASHWFILENKT